MSLPATDASASSAPAIDPGAVADATPADAAPGDASSADPSADATPVDATPADPSAAPLRERGVRTRAGNAMDRTRAAVVDGAVRAIEKYGTRRATMGDIAALSGIAKGTLYNHFRTKEAVYAAAIDAGIHGLAAECAAVAARDDLADALAIAAERIGAHPALRRIASDEPAVLARLVTIDRGGDGLWAGARDAAREVLAAAGRGTGAANVDLLVRWLMSFVADAGVEVDVQARMIAAALV